MKFALPLKLKQQEKPLLKAINSFRVGLVLLKNSLIVFTHICRLSQQNKLLSISQFWGNLGFHKKVL